MSNPQTALPPAARRVLQVVYDLMRSRNAWPSFRSVDQRLDRGFGIADPQAALAAVPAAYLMRSWRAQGYYDTDEVRLSIRGVLGCEGGPDDVAWLVRLLRWVADTAQQQDPDDESDLTITSADFAEAVELDIGPNAVGSQDALDAEDDPRASAATGSGSASAEARNLLARLRLLAMLVPPFWVASGLQPEGPWKWQYTLDHRRVRAYRKLASTEDLLRLIDADLEQRTQASPVVRDIIPATTAGMLPLLTDSLESGVIEDDELQRLATLLRPEILDDCWEQVKAQLFDDAVFAAYRRVEATIQQRAGLQIIGNELVKQAFRDQSQPIRVSERTQDAERLVQLFGGALGLFKGDRSHKYRPALPCRNLRECARHLAAASVLLDVLDRDLATAPSLKGFNRTGDQLDLRVDRAGPHAEVWLDDRPCRVLSHRPGVLTVDVTDVPTGSHRLLVIDGTRVSPEATIPLLPIPDGTDDICWTVAAVDVPLFSDSSGDQRHDVLGVRLTTRHPERHGWPERTFPTRQAYRVGDYVRGHSSPSEGVGPTWGWRSHDQPLEKLWDRCALFDGEPIGAGQDTQLLSLSIEPPHLLARLDERLPIRTLAHYTDGVDEWQETLTNVKVEVEDAAIAHVNGRTVIAKGYGTTTLHFSHEGCYAEATVHVAAHPSGTTTHILSGLPAVGGLARIGDAIAVSLRTSQLWTLRGDGSFEMLTEVPTHWPYGYGTDHIEGAPNGDLAVRMMGSPDLLVLDAASQFRRSRWVRTRGQGSISAMTWAGDHLVVALHTGLIAAVEADGTLRRITDLTEASFSMAFDGSALLVFVGSDSRAKLWRIPVEDPESAVDLLLEMEPPVPRGQVAVVAGRPYFSDFYNGRLLLLEPDGIVEVAVGLATPTTIVGAPDGSIYVAEFGKGAVRRILDAGGPEVLPLSAAAPDDCS